MPGKLYILFVVIVVRRTVACRAGSASELVSARSELPISTLTDARTTSQDLTSRVSPASYRWLSLPSLTTPLSCAAPSLLPNPLLHCCCWCSTRRVSCMSPDWLFLLIVAPATLVCFFRNFRRPIQTNFCLCECCLTKVVTSACMSCQFACELNTYVCMVSPGSATV